MAAIQSLSTAAIIAMINAGQVFPLSTGALVNLNDQLAVDVSQAASVTIGIKNTGSAAMAAGLFTFEASLNSTNGTDGDWFAVQGIRSNSNTIESTTVALALAAATANPYAWTVSTDGVAWFRIRVSTALTASSIAAVSLYRTSFPSEPIPGIATHPVTISGTPAVTVSSGAITNTPAAGTAFGLTGAATTNATVIKATAGKLYELSIFNPTAALIYIKLFNKGTAPVPGTDLPFMTISVPINGNVNVEFGAIGKQFSTGISIATTAGPLGTDVAVIGAGAQISATYI